MTTQVLPSPNTATSVDPHAAARERHPWDDRTTNLLRAAADADGVERRRLVNEVVLLNLRLAESIARRYRGRGIDREDLVQVANLGLVHAAQRFDPDMGRDFVSFAVPTITGEVKRYFRDHGWAVRPPRRVQELHAAITAASAQISQTRGATPSATDLARHLDVEVDEVREASASHECFSVASIDYRGGSGDETPLADTLGIDDAGFDRAEAVVTLAPACRNLRPRDRRILYLRFFRGWTQQEIAQDLGVTQMQVSRLLTRILGQLRAALEAGAPARRQPR